MSVPVPASPQGNPWQLALATGAFTVCFAVFGSVSAMMPTLRAELDLTAWQVSVALALPVLLGSLGRVPLGLLTDRYGARAVFSATMIGALVPSIALGFVTSFAGLVLAGFFVGVALASFSVGVGMVSRWYPPRRQGFALGVYGAGNIGQSVAAFGAPAIAGVAGTAWGFWSVSALTLVWLVLFVVAGRDAPHAAPPPPLRHLLAPLADRMCWVLCLYYFLTFGGFVAMSIYLPTFLTELFELSPTEAGARTAGFIVFATLARPLGGALADRVGGARILLIAFPSLAGLSLLLTASQPVPFTLGALGVAVMLGLGNGAVFKLVPEIFPNSVGSVTGVVGAAGGLGGFFPPLLIGSSYELTGTYTLSFALLSATAAFCALVAWRVHRAPPLSA